MWPVLARQARYLALVAYVGSAAALGVVRFNWLYPPFDNVKMRQAVMMVASQADYHDRVMSATEILECLRVLLHLRGADGQQRRLGRR